MTRADGSFRKCLAKKDGEERDSRRGRGILTVGTHVRKRSDRSEREPNRNRAEQSRAPRSHPSHPIRDAQIHVMIHDEFFGEK
jgi:hypothetical protein